MRNTLARRLSRSNVVLLVAAVLLWPISVAAQAQAATTHAGTPALSQRPHVTYRRLAVTTGSLPRAAVGQPYEFRFLARGAGGHVVWSAIGSLPAGLTLDPATGVLSGVPTAAGSQQVLVTASLVGNRPAVGWGSGILTVESPAVTNVAFSPTTHPGSSQTIHIWGSGFGAPRSGDNVQACVTGRAGRQCATLTVTSWTDDEIVAAVGAGAGSARGLAVKAGQQVVLQANGARWTGPAELVPARTTPRILAVPKAALLAHVGTPFELTLPAMAEPGPGSLAVVSGRLPNGLTLDRSTGVISGIPAQAGPDSFTVRASGAGSSAFSAPITLTVSASVTVPEPTVASGLYQSIYFSKLGTSSQLENLLLADVATREYAADRMASSSAVTSSLTALREAFDHATNRLVPHTGIGLGSFGPNLVPQLAGATGVMMSFAKSGKGGLIAGAVEAVATSVYRSYLKTNMATALGLQVSYEGFNDRTVYDSGDVAGSAFHALVSAPAIKQAVSCGQASPACAAVVDSLLKPVTGVSVRATPAEMQTADSTLSTMLSGLGLAISLNGTMTTSVKAFDQALSTAGGLARSIVTTAATDVASLISMAGDPAAPTDPTATAAASATDLTATAQGFSTALTSGSFLSGIGNAIDPSTADSSDDSLLSGDSIAQGTESLLKTLGSDNATQNTEIADTIGAFVDVCTGNFADAIKQVFSILGAATSSGSGQKQSEAFMLARQTQKMIENVYKKLSAQLTQVQKQISQVQTTLDNLYKTMIADFAQINFELYTISTQLASDEVQLTQLQYAVDVVDQNLLDLGAWQWANQITSDENHCLDYAQQFPTLGPLPKPLYTQCAGDFVTDAQDAWDPALELPVPNVANPYSNATIAAQLGGGYDPAKELLYLLSILHSRGDSAAPPTDLVNPDAWAQVALDYRELLDENPEYSAGPEPDLPAVEASGQQVAAAIGALQQVSGGQNKVVNDVTTNYSNALAAVVTDITNRQNAFPSTESGPAYAAYEPASGSWDGYNAFNPNGAEQAIPSGDDPQQTVSSLVQCGNGAAVPITPASWENGANNAANPLANPPNSWYLLYHLVGYGNASLQPTTTPLCYTFGFTVTNFHCNPKTGLCTWDDNESGTLTDQFEGTDGALHPMATVGTPVEVVGCATGQTNCASASSYFNSEITNAGGLVQYLTSIGLTKATPDVSVLESEGDQILAAEQKQVYQWVIDGFNPNSQFPDTQLIQDMQSLDGAFILMQLTAQTIAPSASLGNQAVSDILYGNDQLATTPTGPNNPVAVLKGLQEGTSSTTVAQWQAAQNSLLTETQGLLNGYLASAAAGAGNVPTAEGPDLVLSVLAQLNSGKLLDVDSVQVKNPGRQRTAVGKSARLQLSAKSQAGARIVRWSATGLPPGLRITTTGLITGKPTKAGTYRVHVTAADALRTTGKATFTWTVVAG